MRVVTIGGALLAGAALLLTACGHTYGAQWDATSVSPEGKTISITAAGSPCDTGRPAAKVSESAETVTIVVRLRSKSNECAKVAVPRSIDVGLRAPLGGRALRGCRSDASVPCAVPGR